MLTFRPHSPSVASRVGLLSLFFLMGCSPVKRNLDDLMGSEGGGTAKGGEGGDSSPTGGRSGTSLGGASAKGGSTDRGGSSGGNGGTTSTGGSTTTGGTYGTTTSGTAASGGTTATGGSKATGGTTSTGGTTAACVPSITTLEINSNVSGICNDGIDNDCNGTIDCPIISNRYPPVGLASAGDDAMVRLNSPNTTLTLQRIECRTDRTPVIGTKTWTTCNTTSPTNLTIYAMGDTAAKTSVTNGVQQFEFRFVYSSGKVSDARAVAFYSHNSLYDGVAGTPQLLCAPTATDDAFFKAAEGYLVAGGTTTAFATGDVQLKNPFIYLRLNPMYVGNFVATTGPQEIKLYSLRHRFLLSPDRQLLLIARQYSSSRSATGNSTFVSCLAGNIRVHNSHVGGVYNMFRSYGNRCEAIVLNKAGAGVCLAVKNGVPVLVDENSSKIVTFLNSKLIAWPKSDPMMWQKFLVDDRPKRNTLRYFSDKCVEGDATCLLAHPKALVLPDQGHAYFNNP